jgi:capsular polysaccharide biosynthesis protein
MTYFLVRLRLFNTCAKFKIEQKRSKNAQKVSKNEKYVKKWREIVKTPLLDK